MTRPSQHVVDLWRSDLPGGDFGWQCYTCGKEQGGYLGWGTAEIGARKHEAESVAHDRSLLAAMDGSEPPTWPADYGDHTAFDYDLDERCEP